MELIFVRHGESEGNVKKVLYGHTDYPLTTKGQSQIPHIIEQVKHFKADKIYTSPLVRAKCIGDAIGSVYDLPVVVDDRLKEMDFGDYEDVSREDVVAEVGQDKYFEVIGFFDHYAIPGGEHQDDFLKRVQEFVDEVLAGEDGTYLITAHFGVIKAAINYLLGYSKAHLRTMAIKPGAIIKLKVKPDRVRLDELIQTFDRI